VQAMKKWLLMGFFILLAGCQSASNDSENRQVQVVAPHGNTSYALTYLMANEPDFAGADLNFEIAPNAEALAARVMEGVDIAIVPVNMAASLYNRDAGYVVAGVATWGNLFVLTTDDSINSWDDLTETQVYGFGRGLVPGATFQYLLARNNVDIEVEFLSSPGEVAQALIGGVAETVLLADEKVTQVLDQSDARVILDLNSEWGPNGYPQAVIIVSKDLIDHDAELVRELLAEMEFSMNWANEHPEQLGILSAELDEAADAMLVQNSIQRLNIRFTAANAAQGQILDFLEALYGMNPELVGGTVPSHDFFYEN